MRSIILKTFYALMTMMVILLVAMWIVHIFLLLTRGMIHESINEIIMFTLCILCLATTHRMEKLANTNALLSEEVQRLHDVKIFVEMLREMQKEDKMEQEVANIMKEHFENKENKQ